MSAIFVSFRNGDEGWAAKRIVDRLVSHFGERDVFYSHDSIRVGDHWQRRLRDALDRSNVLIAVIGPNWPAKSDGGPRRIDDPDDWVRREIRFMLTAQRPVLPVLVDGADPLETEDLPPDIAALAEIQFIRLDKSTIDGLIDQLVVRLLAVLPPPPCPYRGLDAFTEDDHEYFFGRSREVVRLVDRLARQAVLAVEGDSGSGKSSLVRAGLAPALRPAGRTVVVFDAHDPLLRSELPHLRDGTVVCIDQFEQLVASDVAAARDLFELLLGLVREDPAARVVVTVRSSADLHDLPGSTEVVESGGFLVRRMADGELAKAIREPAVKVGRDFEPGLVERIVRHADGQPSQLPLVEFMLTELWAAQPPSLLTVEKYDRLGGVKGALRQRAQEIYGQMATPAGAARFRNLLIRLARPRDDGGRGYILSPVRLDRLDPALSALAAELSAARLLVIRRGVDGAEYVSIAHEALVRHWDQLAEWLSEHREFLSWKARLNGNIDQWVEGGRDAGALLRGTPLADARERLRTSADLLDDVERKYIEASAREARRITRRSRRLVATAGLSLVAVLGIGIGGYFAARTAYALRDMADSRKASGAANPLRNVDPVIAAQLQLAAYRMHPTPDALGGLLSAVGSPSPIWTRLRHSDDIEAAAFGRDGTRLAIAGNDGALTLWDVTNFRTPRDPLTLSRHKGAVRSVAFDGTGRLMATGGADRTVVLWDTTTDDVKVLSTIEMTGEVRSVALSANGRFLLVGGSDHTATLWDLLLPHDARRLHLIDRHTDEVRVAFHPDGRTFATASVDRPVTVWRVDHALNVHEVDATTSQAEGVYSVGFSPDGRYLGTGTSEGKVALWRLEPLMKVSEVADGPPSRVSAVVFSPDRKHLATTSHDGATRWWDISDPTAPILLTAQSSIGSPVTSAAIDPRGKVLVSAGGGATARMWDVTAIAPAHAGPVLSTKFNHRGDVLASSGMDRKFRLWDARDHRHLRLLSTLEAHGDNIDVTLWSPDDSTLTTTSLDGSIRLWDVTDRTRPRLLDAVPDAHGARGPHTGAVTAVLTADGDALFTGGFDGALKLWSIRNGRITGGRQLEQRVGRITRIALGRAADRDLLAVGSEDDVITMWDVTDRDTPREVGRTSRLSEVIWAAAFTPDGAALAVGGTSGKVRLFDVRDPANPGLLAVSTYDDDHVGSIMINEDSLMALATGSGRIELVDVRNPGAPAAVATLSGHERYVRTVDLAPDGTTLASGGLDRSVHIWELDPEQAARRLCDEFPHLVDESNWNTYLGEISYQEYC